MARTDITVQDIPANAELEATYEAANVDGNMFANTGEQLVHIKNGATDVQVTVTTPATQAGLAVDDLVFTVTASEERIVGFLSPGTFNQASGADAGKVYIDYDDVTNVTIAVLKP